MDPPESAKTRGLPRFSKLPARPGHTTPSGSIDEGQGASGISGISRLPARPTRSGTIEAPRPASAMRSYAEQVPSGARNRTSMLVKPGFQAPAARAAQEWDTNTIASPTSPVSPRSNLSDGSSIEPNDLNSGMKTVRRPRPSLSDRTMETLSQVPPSPSPARRKSGFQMPESPMGPPSRTTSALGFSSRPGSRIGTSSIPGSRIAERPASPHKRAPEIGSGLKSPTSSLPASKMVNQRSVSSTMPKTAPAAIKRPGTQSQASGARPGSRLLPSPSVASAGTNGAGSRIGLAGKTTSARPPGARSPVKDVFGGPLQAPSTASRLQGPPKSLKPLSKRPVSMIGPPKGLRKPQPKAPASVHYEEEGTQEELPQPPLQKPKVPAASQSLRDTIAKAKAARRSLPKQNDDAFVPRSVDDSLFADVGPGADPTSLSLVDSTHVNILKKRANNARKDGKLNIAALCLTEIPAEVFKMYDFDENDTSNGSWFENVDVTRILAADNEFKELPSSLFPSENVEGGNTAQDDSESTTGIFTGVTDMDLHGNILQSLPLTMGNMPVLSSLNLSRNQLGNDALDVISLIKPLRELRLAENKLSGTLPDCIGQMEQLLVLDVHRNSLTDLPASIGRLSMLTKLNVSENRLSSIPFEAIFDLQITEIIASRNRLSGPLLPSSIPQIPALKHLDVSSNALTAITEEVVDFPALQTFDISNNRISELPSVKNWVKLSTLNAEENKLSALPDGFTKLTQLKMADLGNNSLLHLDDAIGFMDSLLTLNIKNNPMKERRLLRLGTTELKSELRSRQPVDTTPSKSSTSAGLNQLAGQTSTAWPVSYGTLDRSNTKLQAIGQADLEPILNERVISLVLHHNQLLLFSPAIELFGGTLTSLDLSYNKLSKGETYIPHQLSLPNLQNLNLTSNALATLDPLVNNLAAPRLTTLIVAFNRLTALPPLCTAFPALSKLIAANNVISVLDVDAVRGVQVLDVSSNEIEHLPPKLALLQGQLRTLMIAGNKFRVPGYALLQKGTEEVLKWCRTKIPAGEEGAFVDGE